MKESVAIAATFIISALVFCGIFFLCYGAMGRAVQNVRNKWREMRYHRELATHVERIQREREEQLERRMVEKSLRVIHDMEEARSRHDEEEAGHQLRRFEEFGGITVTREVLVEWHDLDGSLLFDPVETPPPSIHENEVATSIYEII